MSYDDVRAITYTLLSPVDLDRKVNPLSAFHRGVRVQNLDVMMECVFLLALQAMPRPR